MSDQDIAPNPRSQNSLINSAVPPISSPSFIAAVSADGRKRIIHKPKPDWLGGNREPPEHGTKEIPEGKPDCLAGKVFVITGLNKCLTPQETSDLIFDHGGYVLLLQNKV